MALFHRSRQSDGDPLSALDLGAVPARLAAVHQALGGVN
jgi:hypothetical protein